jgi:1-deoxy-D-xylulose-5-phosphate reductoisomerase
MKKKIAILGSTGSIGKTTFNIIKKNKKNFEIVLLTTNKNINEILKQTGQLKVKNIIVTSKPHYLKIKKKLKNKNIKVFNSFNDLQKIIKKKIDYSMSSIAGLAGLKPTIDCIKFTKTIAIANKESIICGWNLIQKKLKKFKTEFIPVDSEHFSIWSLLNNKDKKNIEEIIITASGGPFLNLSKKKFNKIKSKDAIKHPNWNMGKKISIDSATLMNKVFEVIEAQKIFEIDYKKFKVLTHPKSYVHAIVKFNNGLTKILIHDTDMKIPIFNSIYNRSNNYLKTKKLDYKKLNNLNFKSIDSNKFPSIKILNKLNNKNTLFETVLVSANDELVDLFLQDKIKFTDISKILKKILNDKKYKRYQHLTPNNYREILNLDEYVRLKTRVLSVLS